ncbi:hypothetical protein DLAC_02754 [Tieghemostelium lacteum]|uniref:Uncharacterized protein n=1 Tax=Tieghemostelium lacteum TaxID=361077 RepID=A0A152A3D6_TIELA|nr:hypothetical protein DLAC_02754 [Tieghemostelium lacteum]|eukprot:KYR00714.1 hypothetical protein DLAC_02754 [Tieghemostelium lacteum]
MNTNNTNNTSFITEDIIKRLISQVESIDDSDAESITKQLFSNFINRIDLILQTLDNDQLKLKYFPNWKDGQILQLIKILKSTSAAVKQFRIKGGLLPNDLTTYKIDNSLWDKEYLLPLINNKEFVLYFAPRGSGKSTRINRFVNEIPQYISILVDFQYGIDFGSVNGFWKSFGSILNQQFPTSNFSIQNETDFVMFFSKHLWIRPVVLFIDEFDLLFLKSDQNVYTDILKTFRGIKHSLHTAIYSLVAIGSFGILKLINFKLSPFNITSRLRVPYFSENQVLELFGMYSADRPYLNPLSIQDIAKDIYSKTNGHPGHTVLCGILINDKLVSVCRGANKVGKLPIDLNSWKEYYAKWFWSDSVNKWSTLKVMASLLFNQNVNSLYDSQIKKIIDLLINHALVSSGFSIPASMLQDFEYLFEEGIIYEDRNELHGNVRYTFTSDFVRNYMMILCKNYFSKLLPLTIISTPVPSENDYLNMYEILSTTFNRFLPKDMVKLSFTNAFNRKRFSGSMDLKRDHLVPQEYFYHFLLFEILSIWLSPSYTITPEASTFTEGENETKYRWNILITNSLKRNYVIEIVASQDDIQIGQHLEQVKAYAKMTSTPVLIIITVVNDVNNPKLWNDLPSAIVSEKEVNIIHIQHDQNVNYFNIQTNQQTNI